MKNHATSNNTSNNMYKIFGNTGEERKKSVTKESKLNSYNTDKIHNNFHINKNNVKNYFTDNNLTKEHYKKKNPTTFDNKAGFYLV